MLALKTRKDSYFDSVMLMGISSKLRAMPGVEDASVAMGTPANIAWMADGGLLPESERPDVTPADLLIAVKGEEDAVKAALQQIDGLLAGKAERKVLPGEAERPVYRSVAQAAQQVAGANIALISVAGAYARLEAEQALRAGLHVHLFSDNVPVEDEIALKEMAGDLGLLVMGPDCGTAIISSKGLGFANRVARGDVGIVGASGTGIQQFSCLLDAMGVGVSHALGTGGHDLSDRVGGATFKSAIRALGADPGTKVLALISKPPSATVADEVVREAVATGKPVVVCFLGADMGMGYCASTKCAGSLEEAARLAARLSAGSAAAWPLAMDAESAKRLREEVGAPRTGAVRGLFCGGTLCTEAQLVLSSYLPGVRSNAPFKKDLAWSPGSQSEGHLLIDMGDDYYTVGRPHPMMDGSERLRQLQATLAKDDTSVVMLDLILGSGAETDPAGPLAEALKAARAAGHTAPVVVSFCAAQADPQGFDAQAALIRDAGAYLFRSNAAAARAVAALMLGDASILA